MEGEDARIFLPASAHAVIPNLVDLPELVLPRTNNDVFTIGFLSRIDPKKGLDLLIQSLANVEFPYRLLVGGSGDEAYLETLKKLAESCGNADKIVWEGWKDTDQKFVFLAGLDLFALTSHNENSAIVVVESLAMGTPVFVSDHVGLKQYVEENDFGWVSEMHLEAIARALNDAHRDIKKRKRVVEAAPARVREDFNSENLARKYESLYQRVVQVEFSVNGLVVK